MPPHMHLKIIVSVEGFGADRARELSRANENLRGGGDPVLALVQGIKRAVSRNDTTTTDFIFLDHRRGGGFNGGARV